ncbi:hypothetical protein N9Z73_00070 [bacterium]|nr:hypothetical protein [bacterium]
MYQSIFVDRHKRKVHLWDDKEGYIIEPLHPYLYGYVKDPRGKKKAIDGKTVRRVKINPEVKEAAKHPDKRHLYYETDVPLETRVLIDKYGDSDTPSTNLREFNFDIETEILQGFPDWRNPVNKITAIAWHEKLSNQYGVLVLDEDGLVDSSVKDNVEIISCASEIDLLEIFIEKYTQINPHILTGWNVEGFDVPYLVNRMGRVLGDEATNKLSPVRRISYREGIDKWFIEGVSILDYMLLYKKFTMGEKPTYRLDAIGKDEVNLGKIEYDGNLDDLFSSDINKYIDYNLNDVEIVKRLDDKLKFIDLARAICHKGHVPYQQIHITSAYLEGAILTHTHRLGVVTKNKPHDVVKDTKFSGAFVKVPNPGRYDWIYDLDLTSLYPSIIMTLNISPETKIGIFNEFDVDAFRARKPRNWRLDIEGKSSIDMKDGEILEFLETEKCSIGSNGAVYKTDKAGLIPAILDRWFKERVEYKDLRKKFEKEGNEAQAAYFDQMQYVTKILLNSMYGVLGMKTFRFFDIDNAEAVTATGQQLIKATGEFGSKFYNDEIGTTDVDYIIYTDTDSVFLSALPIINKRYPHIDVEDKVAMTKAILPIAGEVQEYINKMYDLYAKRIHNVDTHRFDIKQELISKSGIWIAKKRYAQWVINQEGHPCDKLDVKGIDVVRSSFPAAMRTFLADVLQGILENKTQFTIDEMIVTFRDTMKQMPVADIAKSTGVKNIEKHVFKDDGIIELQKGAPAHVKAAVAYNNMLRRVDSGELGEIRSGDKIKWVYLKTNSLGLDAMAFKNYDDPQEIIEFINKYVNYDKIFDRELHNKLESFYGALKWGAVPNHDMKQINKFFDFS